MEQPQTQTTLGELLRGCRTGLIQTVGLMQVIPLTSEHSDERFAPLNRAVVSTRNYGHLVFRNPTDKPLLIPRDAAYVTKQRAQDHALPHVALIKAGATAEYRDAACIQETQGGYMEAGEHELIILPFKLREAALAQRRAQSYDKLWATIQAFNRAMGLRSAGHVDIFLEQFGQQLRMFAAEFEPVANQVGAIILINGHVAGIERAPSHGYWAQLWPTLIRECYGSLALYVQQQEEDPRPLPARFPLPDEVEDLDDLQAALDRTRQAEETATRETVRQLIDEPLAVEAEAETLGGLQVETLQSPHFAGQHVRDGGQTIYASLVATEARLAMEPAATAVFQL